MTRAVDAQQDEFYKRQHLSPVNLIKLTTYSDKKAGTAGTIFYLSDRAVDYDYGNTGSNQHFWPVVRDFGTIATTVNHVPSQFESEIIRKPLRIELSNETYRGSRLITLLRAATGKLENATIEVSQILVDSQTVPTDLTALTGDEHTVLYRGAVERVGPISEESIQLECTLDLPRIGWLRATDETKTDPIDLGARLPVIYGQAKRVEAVSYDVGFITTLAEYIGIDDRPITLEVTDTTGFSTTGSARIGGEEISWTGTTATTLTGVMWNLSTTVHSEHTVGEIIVEMIDGAAWVVAGHQVDAIDTLYVINPFDNKLTRVDETEFPFTKTIADTTTISGQTVATVSFTIAQLRELMNSLYISATVTRQQGTPVANVYTQHPIQMYHGKDDVENRRQARVGSRDDNEDQPSASVICDDSAGGVEDQAAFEFLDLGIGHTSETLRFHVATAAGFSGGANVGKATEFSTSTPVAKVQSDNIPNSSIPNSPTAAAWVESAITTQVELDKHWAWIETDTGSEWLNVYEMERVLTGGIEVREATEEGDSTNDSGAVNPDNVIDGSTSTFTDIDNNDWVEVVFPAPTESYIQQRIHIFFHSTNSGTDLQLQVDTVHVLDDDSTNVLSYFAVLTGELVTFDTDEIGNTIRVTSNSTNLLISRIYRSLIHTGAGPSTDDATIKGGSVGYGLRMFADVDGYEAPSGGAYKAAVGAVMTSADDIARHFIEVLGGATVDSTTFATMRTNHGSNAFAGDIRGLGFTFSEIMARLGYEFRTNFVPEEAAAGTVWRGLTAETDHEWSAASGSFAEWESFIEAGRQLAELGTRLTAFYGFDASNGTREEAYGAFLRADSDVNDLNPTPIPDADIDTAEDEVGVIEAEPFAFLMIQEAATAKDIFGYYVHEALRTQAKLFAVKGVPWWEAYAVEVGDVMDVTAPWDASSTKIRVIEYTKVFSTEEIELRVVEVV